MLEFTCKTSSILELSEWSCLVKIRATEVKKMNEVRSINCGLNCRDLQPNGVVCRSYRRALLPQAEGGENATAFSKSPNAILVFVSSLSIVNDVLTFSIDNLSIDPITKRIFNGLADGQHRLHSIMTCLNLDPEKEIMFLFNKYIPGATNNVFDPGQYTNASNTHKATSLYQKNNQIGLYTPFINQIKKYDKEIPTKFSGRNFYIRNQLVATFLFAPVGKLENENSTPRAKREGAMLKWEEYFKYLKDKKLPNNPMTNSFIYNKNNFTQIFSLISYLEGMLPIFWEQACNRISKETPGFDRNKITNKLHYKDVTTFLLKEGPNYHYVIPNVLYFAIETIIRPKISVSADGTSFYIAADTNYIDKVGAKAMYLMWVRVIKDHLNERNNIPIISDSFANVDSETIREIGEHLKTL